jgi:hypothetical protein
MADLYTEEVGDNGVVNNKSKTIKRIIMVGEYILNIF